MIKRLALYFVVWTCLLLFICTKKKKMYKISQLLLQLPTHATMCCILEIEITKQFVTSYEFNLSSALLKQNKQTKQNAMSIVWLQGHATIRPCWIYRDTRLGKEWEAIYKIQVFVFTRQSALYNNMFLWFENNTC